MMTLTPLDEIERILRACALEGGAEAEAVVRAVYALAAVRGWPQTIAVVNMIGGSHWVSLMMPILAEFLPAEKLEEVTTMLSNLVQLHIYCASSMPGVNAPVLFDDMTTLADDCKRATGESGGGMQ